MRIDITLDSERDGMAMVLRVMAAMGVDENTPVVDTKPAPKLELVGKAEPTVPEKPKRQAKSGATSAPAEETKAETTEQSNSAETTSEAEVETRLVVDAGTGQTVEVTTPAAEGGATREQVKERATILTTLKGGNAKVKELFGQYKVEKFSGLSEDDLTPFLADVEEAIADLSA